MKIFKKILIVLGWLCLTGVFGFSIYFVNIQRENVRCETVVVNINPNSPRFFDEIEIEGFITKSGINTKGVKLTDINLNKLEAKLGTYTTLDNIEVYRKIEAKGFSFKGKLIVNVDQRTPVIRIKNSVEDYYLDYKGTKIPVSPKYVERILIATGDLPESISKESLLKIAEYINKNDFWKAQIEQVMIKPNGELLIVPQVGDYIIEFGTADDYKTKLRNLMAVYREGFKNTGWNKYRTISVKYSNQVVCQKK